MLTLLSCSMSSFETSWLTSCRRMISVSTKCAIPFHVGLQVGNIVWKRPPQAFGSLPFGWAGRVGICQKSRTLNIVWGDRSQSRPMREPGARIRLVLFVRYRC